MLLWSLGPLCEPQGRERAVEGACLSRATMAKRRMWEAWALAGQASHRMTADVFFRVQRTLIWSIYGFSMRLVIGSYQVP